MQTKNFSEIKNDIRAFDLIAFRGDDFVADSISFLQKLQLGKSDWTHVGIVVDMTILPDLINGRPDKLYIWESTMSGKLTDGVPDLETGKSRLGVQVRDLEQVVNGYLKDDAKIGFCKLNNNPLDTLDIKSIQEKMNNMYKEYGRSFYDGNCLSLLSALFPGLRCIYNTCKIGKSWMFCSELVATVYKDFKLIDANPEHTVPQDFVGYDQDGIKKDLVQSPILITKDIIELSILEDKK